jgi:hypothetical protein
VTCGPPGRGGTGHPGAQQLDRADGAGRDAGREGALTAAGVPAAAVPGASDAERDAAAMACVAGRVDAGAAGEAAAAGDDAGAWVAGSASLPPPYIQVPVGCTAPGSSVIPETVAWWPWVSVSRTVNGPGPEPDCAIQ